MSPPIDWSKAKITEQNPIGINGIDFVEYAGVDAQYFEKLFKKQGFSELGKVDNKDITLFRQGDINFILNTEPGNFAALFAKAHGTGICAIGLRVANATRAFNAVVKRGARPYDGSQILRGATPYLAIYGVADSLIYFIDKGDHVDLYENRFNVENNSSNFPEGAGLKNIDRLTNHVPKDEIRKCCDFYTNVLGFSEVDVSKVMRSPCSFFNVIISESGDGKSQIQVLSSWPMV